MNHKLKNNILLFITAFIWGSSFVAQSAGMSHVGPLTFNGARCLLGAFCLGVVWFLINRFHILEDPTEKQERIWKEKLQALPADSDLRQEYEEVYRDIHERNRKSLLAGGVLCGLVLTVASALQQIGMLYTTAGKAGFLTAMYMILIPIWGMFFGKRVSGRVWVAVLLSISGMYLLCIKDGLSMGLGDMLVLLCSLFYMAHILVIDHFSPKVNGIKLSCIQFLISGTLCMGAAFLFERPSATALLVAWFPLFYAGGLSCAVAYTLQIIAQKDTDPTIASLLFSLESVFAVVGGWIVLGEALSKREMIGCVLMFTAIVLAQLPARQKNQPDGSVSKQVSP